MFDQRGDAEQRLPLGLLQSLVDRPTQTKILVDDRVLAHEGHLGPTLPTVGASAAVASRSSAGIDSGFRVGLLAGSRPIFLRPVLIEDPVGVGELSCTALDLLQQAPAIHVTDPEIPETSVNILFGQAVVRVKDNRNPQPESLPYFSTRVPDRSDRGTPLFECFEPPRRIASAMKRTSVI